ncbi:MAG: hypothetical protein UZ18_ATM001001917, partial [Armatimonadetes bacterium OLB18]
MPTLEVRDVVMQFPAIRALDGVSPLVRRGPKSTRSSVKT